MKLLDKEQIVCLPSGELLALMLTTVVRSDEVQFMVDEAQRELRKRAGDLNMYCGDYVRFYRALAVAHA